MPKFREFTQSSLEIEASMGNREWFAKASMQIVSGITQKHQYTIRYDSINSMTFTFFVPLSCYYKSFCIFAATLKITTIYAYEHSDNTRDHR